MKTLTSFIGRLLPALLLAAFFAACDSSPSAIDDSQDATTDGVAQLSAVLASELQMSAIQVSAVEETATRFGDGDAGDPGYLWYLAQELSETLTPEQIEALLARAEGLAQRMRQQGMAGPFGPHPQGFGGPGFNGRRPGLGELGAGPGIGSGPCGGDLDELLTDEQKAELHALRQEWAEQIRAAAEAVRAGDPSREEAIAALESLLEDMRAAVDQWLQDNAPEAWEAIQEARAECESRREEFRAAVRAAIEAVLGEGVADQLEVIHDAFVEAVEAARETCQADRDCMHEAIQAAAEIRDAAVEALLGENGYLIFRIHQALQVRAANMHGNGFGRQGPQGNGNGFGPGGQHGPGGQNGPGGPGYGPGGQNGPGGNGASIHHN